MKKILLFGMMGALALTFTACSSDDAVNENVIVTKDGDAVKTRFAMSLTNQLSTRMTATAAQENENFNGIKDIVLFPSTEAAFAQTTPLALQKIQLADFNAFDVTTANAKVYSDVVIPVGVKSFLFYGRTQKPFEGELKASYDSQVITTGSTPKDKIYFDLVPFNEGMTLADLTATDEAKAVIEALNAIYGAVKAAGLTETTAIFETLTAGNTNSIGFFIADLVQVLTKGDIYKDDVKTAVEKYFTVSGSAEAGFTATWKGTAFPAKYNLPDGSVVVKFADGAFAYAQGTVDGLNTPAPGEYVKPAELFYWVKTTAMVSDKAEYNLGNWDGKAWLGTDGVQGLYTDGAVTATTQSVIMKDQVQYGVGRLDVSARLYNDDETDPFFYDNGAEGKAPQQVTLPENGYKVTGILIGGQKNVGWDFVPNGEKLYTIWDNTMTTATMAAKLGEAYSAVNYTLALETMPKVTNYIAVEFENTANDFYGVNHQVIPAGSKFYLVAQLDPTSDNAINKEATGMRVFMQDFATKLKLTIGKNSLKNAYNVVPDLRASELEFGLSVNLEWQEGITFEQVF